MLEVPNKTWYGLIHESSIGVTSESVHAHRYVALIDQQPQDSFVAAGID